MKNENLEKLLTQLAEKTAEPVRPDLADDIKRSIPRDLSARRHGLDTTSIIIDLRVGKWTAAAAIAATVILCIGLFGGKDLATDGIQGGKLIFDYWLGGKAADDRAIVTPSKLYGDLVRQGKEVVYYGPACGSYDSNAPLMHWRLDNGNYMIRFVDARQQEVTADQLVQIQAKMLQNRAR